MHTRSVQNSIMQQLQAIFHAPFSTFSYSLVKWYVGFFLFVFLDGCYIYIIERTLYVGKKNASVRLLPFINNLIQNTRALVNALCFLYTIRPKNTYSYNIISTKWYANWKVRPFLVYTNLHVFLLFYFRVLTSFFLFF